MNEGKIDHRRAARAIIQGQTISKALVDAGYSEQTAEHGLTSQLWESAPLREAFSSELSKWSSLIRDLPAANTRAGIARLRLLINVMRGKDQAVQSVKLLGQDREVNMFEPEVAVGIQVAVNPPSSIKSEFLESEDSTKPDK